MKPAPQLLALNGGSSSIKFSLFTSAAAPRQVLRGKLDRIGQSTAELSVSGPGRPSRRRMRAPDHGAAVAALVSWLEGQPWFGAVTAVGHRIVHGMAHAKPARVDGRLLAELRRLTPYAPDHLPIELQLLAALRRRHPTLPQVVCFDTAFHRTMPAVARALPLPRRYTRAGVQRYGFHGLSYQFLTEELGRLRDPAVRRGRVILAHLGNGASLAAVRDGCSVDTSMGFTPAAGLVMGTRSGDLDPGVVAFLARERGLSPAAFDRLVNHDSGLLGVSGTSADMRDLLRRERGDPRAALAVELFCYQARKWIGAYAAVLGGVDTLVFAGGIGENAPVVRARICDGLGFLGIRIDARRNLRNAPVISRSGASATVRVIPTDEELMIARSVRRMLHQGAR